MKVFDFECHNGHITEKFCHGGETIGTCDTCFGTLTWDQRVISAPRFTLEGWSGSFPSAATKWDQRHEKAHRDSVLSGESQV